MSYTYNTLKQRVADWLNRSDLDSVTPSFVTNAEARLEKLVRHRDMEATSSLTFSGGSASLPSDYIEYRLLTINSTPVTRPEFVEPDSREFMFLHRPYSVPQYFTIIGSNIAVQPTYNGSGSLVYYKKLPKLSDTTTTNWLLDRAPEAYLYASLLEGAAYLRDPEMASGYNELMLSAVESVMQDGRKAKLGRVPAPPVPLSTKTEEQKTN